MMRVGNASVAAYRPQPKMAGESRRNAAGQGVSKPALERIEQNARRALSGAAAMTSPQMRALGKLRAVEKVLSDVSGVIQAIPVENRGSSQQFNETLTELKTETREIARAVSRSATPAGVDFKRQRILGVFNELASRNPVVAGNAEKTLRAFGLQDEAIADIRSLVKQNRPSSGPLRFAAKSTEEQLAEYADMILVDNTTVEVLDILASHQVNKIIDLVFGAGAYVVIGYDNGGWPIIEWQNHVL